MKDYSHLDKKTLFMNRTYVQDQGKRHEHFFGQLEATKSAVIAYTEVTPTGGKSIVFEDWLVELFKKNTAKKEFEIGSGKFVPDYTVRLTVDLRAKKG